MRNKYAGTCYYCGVIVKPGEGHFERRREPGKSGWRTIHAKCVFKQRLEKEQSKNKL